MLALCSSFLCIYDAAFKTRSYLLLWSAVSEVPATCALCLWADELCTVQALVSPIKPATSSTAAVIDAQHKLWAFAEKPIFSSFHVWTKWFFTSSETTISLLPMKQRALRCCAYNTQSCLRLHCQLHGYQTYGTAPERTASWSCHWASRDDGIIIKRQNQPWYPMTVAWMLLSGDGNW